MEQIKENSEEVVLNINYLIKIGFEDTNDIFERYPIIFICEHKDFKKKIDRLITRLGFNYVEILENDMSLWEELLW